MANTVYENEFLQNEFESLLSTNLNAKTYLTIDSSLESAPGIKVTVNRYTYTGSVEQVAEGVGNSTYGEVSFVPSEYEVKWYQHSFKYTDEQEAKDPNVVPYGMQGGAEVVSNELTDEYFAELAKANMEQEIDTDSKIYDVVVDATAKMNLEDEAGLFVIAGTDMKARIRKDPDFKGKAQGEILGTGAIGTLNGMPVIISKLCPAGVMYVLRKDAIKLFTKKNSEVAQKRDEEIRTTILILRRVGYMALVNATKLVAIMPKLATPVITTASIANGSNKAFAGTCVAGSVVKVLKNGAFLANATVTDTAWAYTIATAVAGEVYTVRAEKAHFIDSDAAEGKTVS